MKYFYLLFSFLFYCNLQSQSIYNQTDYATIGDVLYSTSVSDLTLDYETTGENYTWDFSTITGVAQDVLEFKAPPNSGFGPFFPFIFFPNNTNLASTNNQTNTLSVGGETFNITNNHDYFLSNNSQLKEVANAFFITINGFPIPVTNEFTDDDIIYNFPINFGDTDSDNSSYSFGVPNVFSQDVTQQRQNMVDGWGTLQTPYETYSNVLRMSTILVKNQTSTLGTTTLPEITITNRILTWFDPSEKLPVLTVTQLNVSGNWVTTNVSYLDIQRDFQTQALFAYNPAVPFVNQIIYFQDLSQNATSYLWDFGDPSSGPANSSTDQYPNHFYNSSGVYQVSLTASNNSFSNTVTLPVVVVEETLAIVDFESNQESKIFPNPSVCFIQVSGLLEVENYKIYNIMGSEINRGKVSDNEKIDVQYLTNGLYYLKFDNGDTLKFIKE
ncbi:MAG: PKD domain-containing protein [Winogradskyella sp.]|nr:PKD domain-containing protein [Winogradskyella sp.]